MNGEIWVLGFIKEVYPVAFITIVLVTIGFIMARINRKARISVYENILESINK